MAIINYAVGSNVCLVCTFWAWNLSAIESLQAAAAVVAGASTWVSAHSGPLIDLVADLQR